VPEWFPHEVAAMKAAAEYAAELARNSKEEPRFIDPVKAHPKIRQSGKISN
jgi:hypothetical protein